MRESKSRHGEAFMDFVPEYSPDRYSSTLIATWLHVQCQAWENWYD